MATQGRAALLAWCKRVTAGYAGVRVSNFESSFRDGLGASSISLARRCAALSVVLVRYPRLLRPRPCPVAFSLPLSLLCHHPPLLPDQARL